MNHYPVAGREEIAAPHPFLLEEPDEETEVPVSPHPAGHDDAILQQYMREVKKISTLSHGKTTSLFRALDEKRREIAEIAAGGNLSAIEADHMASLEREVSEIKKQLVTANLRLVVYLANRYRGRGVPIEDLIQEGNIGLIRAIDRFDHRLGFRFSTYAAWWIRQGILRAIGQQGRLIHIPVHMLERLQRHGRQVDRRKRALRNVSESSPGADEVGGDHHEMRLLTELMKEPLSLEAPITDEGLGLLELTRDEDHAAPEEEAIEHDLREKLRVSLRALSLKEEIILRMRYGIDLPAAHTLEEVGQLFRLTKERIRQIEVQALRRLHEAHGNG